MLILSLNSTRSLDAHRRVGAVRGPGLFWAFLCALGLLAAPAAAPADSGSSGATTSTGTAQADLAAKAPAAPIIDLEKHRGHVVYIDFWASWCKPCRKSFPWLESIHRRYADEGLDVIAINLDKERKKAAAFLEKHPASFEIRYDPQGLAARAFGVEAMPTAFLFDRQGKQIATYRGFHQKECAAVEAAIREQLRPEGEDG
jgi:thiol-disulfide isomerase/thioredoxin